MKRAAIVVAILLTSAGFIVVHQFIQSERQWKLSRAAFAGDLATVKRCMEAGVDVNAVPTMDNGMRTSSPALTAAALEGHEEIVRYLLDHGANPNLKGLENPLIAACWKGHLSIAKLLLERGADPNARGEGTPLMAAESIHAPELANFLRAHGARE